MGISFQRKQIIVILMAIVRLEFYLAKSMLIKFYLKLFKGLGLQKYYSSSHFHW